MKNVKENGQRFLRMPQFSLYILLTYHSYFIVINGVYLNNFFMIFLRKTNFRISDWKLDFQKIENQLSIIARSNLIEHLLISFRQRIRKKFQK